jgi:hypothetical protein
MSVAEFLICGAAATVALAGAHELFRLQSISNTLSLVAHTQAAQISYESLTHLLKGTFIDSKNPTHSQLGQTIESRVSTLLESSLLQWSWFYSSQQRSPITGLRVTLQGPRWGNIRQGAEVKIHVCLQSWIEPFLRVISDRRNCLGQFSSHAESSRSRGISFDIIARRDPNVSLHPYFGRVVD